MYTNKSETDTFPVCCTGTNHISQTLIIAKSILARVKERFC